MKSLYNKSSPPPSPQQLSSHENRFHTSPSETSMTRAQSLVFPVEIKHSPNCKDYPNHKL